MYSSSRTWVHPKVKESSQRQALNYARRKMCPNSPFWTQNFDLAKHKQDWEAGRKRRVESKLAQDLETAEERRKSQKSDFALPRRLRPAFGEKEYDSNHSPVLGLETIFCPQWEKGKENIAPWPNKSEMKYEGDDRISTDRLHGRFLGAPRVEGNETVNWQHRLVIAQYALEEFYYPIPQAVDIFLRTHWIAELEFSDEEGAGALGEQFMDMLDPEDQ